MGYADQEPNDPLPYGAAFYVDEKTRRGRLMPALILSIPMIIAFAAMLYFKGSMNSWAVSGPRLANGDYELILLHMFAHGGIAHIAFNTMALFVFGPAVMERLGPFDARSLSGFVVLFVACGIAGFGFWFALNPTSEIPMLGASGAVFGLLGFVMRKPDPAGPVIPLFSRAMGQAFIEWIKLHIPLIALFAIPMLLGSGFFGLAWEAHLGGFLCGLLLCGPILKWCDRGPDWMPYEREES
ncbi:MAG: rhomboid family intramembrane serine protease [Pseudomonadota bacterium]